MAAKRQSGPRLPLPPPLRSNVPGTWAHSTMSGRIRTDILARIFRENDFSPAVLCRLRALDDELANASRTALTPIAEDGGRDVRHWNTLLEGAIASGATWLTAPWALSEFYFYRRVMAAIGYFREPVDPFAKQKELGLASSAASMDALAVRLNAAVSRPAADAVPDFLRFVLTALWGNRMDLSIWPVGSSGSGADDFSAVIEAGQKFILADNSDTLSSHVTSKPRSRYDIIVDNAGFELFCDLCLADYLVSSGMASTVVLHLKSHPTFVSDAMAKDVADTIDFMQRGSSAALATTGARWASHIRAGAWVLVEDDFWVQPSPMWDMPERVSSDLAASTVVFVKGDANYRRLLGDCHWPLDTPFSDILCYFPAPVCALRTLKAEIGCGLPPQDVIDKIATEDPNWLVNGKYGVIHFHAEE